MNIYIQNAEEYSLKCGGACGGRFHKRCTGLSDEEYLAYEKRKTEENGYAGNVCELMLFRMSQMMK